MRAWTRIVVGLIAVCAGLWAGPLLAQQDNAEKPKPAARVLLPLPDLSGDQQDSDQSDQTMQPDRGPLTGVQSPGLGTSQFRHSYWVPAIQYGNTAQSNTFNTSSTQKLGWTTSSYVGGNLSMLEAGSHSLFGLNYSGGGFFSTDSVQGNGQFHQLYSTLQIDERRWQALVVEQFSYLPQSAYGFGGTSGLSTPGITGVLAVPLPGLQQVFVPGQSVLSTTGPRYSSASAVQLTYAVSRRGSFTVAAVYGLLRFNNSGNIGNDSEVGSVGYNYALTPKDFLGVAYRFTAYHYPGDPQALGDQVEQFFYGRKITGRLGFSVWGGPDITRFRLPVNGTKQTISGGGGAALSYAFAKSSIGLSYSHGIGSGSGVFSGSSTNELNAIWSRSLSRAWSSTLKLGYARNSTIVTIRGLASPSYNSWITAAGTQRPLGSSTTLSIGYQAQIQTSNGILCTGSVCQTTQVTHQVQMSFQWKAPPQVIR